MVDFATHARPFIEADIKVAFASVDSVEKTAALRDGLYVGFPMYAEVDAVAASAALGSFAQTGERTFMHATGFVLQPNGTIDTAVYATGPIGRFTPSDVLRAVSFRRSQLAQG